MFSIDQIRDALTDLPLEQVLLFGSHATGSANEESDLDLIVVVPEDQEGLNFSSRIDWMQRVRHALDAAGIRTAKDILVYSPSQWKAFQSADSSFAREIRESAQPVA